MTVATIEEQVRNILLDTDESNYRFTEKEIYLALKQGISEVRRLRPESRYVNCLLTDFTLNVPQQAPAGGWSQFATTEIMMDEFWMHALVCYVVYRMYLKDDSDTQNANLAKTYLNTFNSEVA